MEHRKNLIFGMTRLSDQSKSTSLGRYGKAKEDSTVSENRSRVYTPCVGIWAGVPRRHTEVKLGLSRRVSNGVRDGGRPPAVQAEVVPPQRRP